MKRGTWMLAISGMMALCQTGNAADPTSELPARRNAAGTTRVTGSGAARKPAAGSASTTKNYYKDLFADDERIPSVSPKRAVADSKPASVPASKASIIDWGAEVDEDRPETWAKTASKTTEKKVAAAKDEIAVGDAPASAETEATGKNVVRPSSRVSARISHAKYDRAAGKKNPIQQIRGDGRPRSAPPIQGLEEAAEKTVHKAEARKEAREQNQFEDIIQTGGDARLGANGVPAAGPQTPQVTVEWVKRGEFNVGQECLVDLIVKNAGDTPVSELAVDAVFPTNVRLTAAEPKPAAATDRLTWTFDSLAPASEKKITVTLIPSIRGEIGATAQVRFTGVSAAAFAVCEPMLKIAIKSSTKEVMLGDPASQMITVTNPGTGTAQDVKIEAKLSEGLEHPTREDRLVIEVGSIGPGETRSYRLGLTAAKGGPQSVSVVATSSSDASSTDTVDFDVVAPSIKVAVEGPSLRYKGRNAKYNLTVTNDGSLANNNIHITQLVASGFKFVSADHSGKFDPSVSTISWFIDRLEPGESTQVACELRSLQIGEFAHTIQVVSESGVQADARIETRVDGIASLTMELVDMDDPVENGAETGYEIRVKNDGSKAATDVSLVCELPAGMEFLSAKAPVEQDLEGRTLSFKPIEQIAPGAQVTFRVMMKVKKEGSHRLKARLTGAEVQDEIVLEEVTRAYSD